MKITKAKHQDTKTNDIMTSCWGAPSYYITSLTLLLNHEYPQ